MSSSNAVKSVLSNDWLGRYDPSFFKDGGDAERRGPGRTGKFWEDGREEMNWMPSDGVTGVATDVRNGLDVLYW